MRGGAIAEVAGASGRLFLDADGRVHRKLAWAEFRSGNAVALPEPEDFGPATDDYDETAPQGRDQVWAPAEYD